MSIPTRIVLSITLLAAFGAVARANPKCADHPMFPVHMPGYSITDCKVTDYDRYEFFATGKATKHFEEGKLTYIVYRLDKDAQQASGLAIVRNYENAVTKLGGTIAASEPDRRMNAKVVLDGKEVWVEVEKGNGQIWMRIVEKIAMVQDIVADAAAFSSDLKRTGHVAVEGVYFDTAKALVKPESAAALDQVAKLLKADVALKLWVVGHTDSVGKLEDNVKLAQARAEAVVAALTATYGIPAARLKGYGSGPLAPIASNDTDEGRAKNRRVELVKQP